MVVSRSPPPLRRSPRKADSSIAENSFASFASQSSHAPPRRIGMLPPSSRPSLTNAASTNGHAAQQSSAATPVHNVYPTLPRPTPQQHPLADFPSLDQMAASSRESREQRELASLHATSSDSSVSSSTSHRLPPSSGTTVVPSSLPRPAKPYMSENADDRRVGRSSLTNGALERARQLAGDETPMAVSQAKSARSAAATTADIGSSGDDSGDRTAQLVTGRNGAAAASHVTNLSIDVERQQLPTLGNSNAPSNRKAGQDKPIGAGGYDFGKYLDGELDPFNRASRNTVRRDSRPLPAPAAAALAREQDGRDSSLANAEDDYDDDHDEESRDNTARGSMLPPRTVSTSASVAPSSSRVPIESTPRIQQVKANAPRMSPHASPSLSSRKLGHLKSLPASNGTGPSLHSASTDGLDGPTSPSKGYDPASRSDRINTLELSELRKKHAAAMRDLAITRDELASAREESEGWASECTGLQEQLASVKETQRAAVVREQRARAELEVRLAQYKVEADDRAWRLLLERRRNGEVEAELGYAKNEASYSESRLAETETDLEMQKDELRIRLMLERKRADLVALHYKAGLRDAMRLKKRLAEKVRIANDLEHQNEELQARLAAASEASANGNGSSGKEVRRLQREVDELRGEMATLHEREEMMAETRKNWKQERKQLLSQVAELEASVSAAVSAASAPTKAAVAAASAPSRSAVSAAPKNTSRARDVGMDEPSSPVYSKKQSRRPMQGASELEVPSEADFAPPPSSPVRASKSKSSAALVSSSKGETARHLASPLVPFTKVGGGKTKDTAAAKSSKTKAASKKSTNWRDEVAITDSSEEEDEDAESDGGRERRRGRGGAAGKKASVAATRAKPAGKTKASTNGTRGGGGGGGSKKLKPIHGIEYDDQTADPSATPMIRTTKKRGMASDDDDEDDDDGEDGDGDFGAGARGGADSSVLGAKFGLDRTNIPSTLTAGRTGKFNTKSAAASSGDKDTGVAKKKKRKLLGVSHAALPWGNADTETGLAPNFDIPLELSPIKATATSKNTGLLANLGFGRGGPFG
ncbi:hypothetical protein BCV70DRAFT_200057 [Testicularia cyperi]|uniref:Uncharacterized protein n=1 Tax=Testicularia cyperi TaxID=1882483 RepID=A0A317XR68_9BASI|nr:hypothetical protein BCV70DRAFT_200057 [Testicularia cyperi]